MSSLNKYRYLSMDHLAKKRNNKLGIQHTHFFIIYVYEPFFLSAHGHVSNIRTMRELQPFKGHRIIHGW